jgi:CarD family transcriptional regulator
MFAISDMVVYKGYGVAKITDELVKSVNGEENVFFELEFIRKDVRILVPKASVCDTSSSLRHVLSKKEIDSIFFDQIDLSVKKLSREWFAHIAMISWNRRSKEYQARIIEGSFSNLVTIYLDLFYIKRIKSLSFGEKAILEQAEDLLVEEIAVSYQKKIEEIKSFLRSLIDGLMDYLFNLKNSTNFTTDDIKIKYSSQFFSSSLP